jgi:hypothetical protein
LVESWEEVRHDRYDPHLGDGDWQSIAGQAGKEMEQAKLLILIEKLCYALDGERRNQKEVLDTDIQGNELSSFLGD